MNNSERLKADSAVTPMVISAKCSGGARNGLTLYWTGSKWADSISIAKVFASKLSADTEKRLNRYHRPPVADSFEAWCVQNKRVKVLVITG